MAGPKNAGDEPFFGTSENERDGVWWLCRSGLCAYGQGGG
jgi:hypothetical protein